MKVIDLLNKIANEEEVPRVQYDDVEVYIGADGYLKDNYGDNVEWWIDKIWLNTEVEIIEEDKKIEKLEHMNSRDYLENRDEYLSTKDIALDIETLRHWINEVIDYINKEK